MASVGHIAVGLAAARLETRTAPTWTAAAWWSALSMLPDADVAGFALGVPYAHPWGHRGATHSIAFALAAGLAIGLVTRARRGPAVRVGLLAALVLVSHGLLDTMTDGGLGCALWWPFADTRYFAPWRPIPVAPIGVAFLSLPGALIALTEIVMFAPVILYGLGGRTKMGGKTAIGVAVALWGVMVWLMVSGSQLRDTVVGAVARERTIYAAGFSDGAFRTIRRGHSETEVRRLLGPPLGESWVYAAGSSQAASAADRSAAAIGDECGALRFEDAVLAVAMDEAACARRGVRAGQSAAEAERRLGRPAESCWQYTRGTPGRAHRMRMVCFARGRVDSFIRRWAWPALD